MQKLTPYFLLVAITFLLTLPIKTFSQEPVWRAVPTFPALTSFIEQLHDIYFIDNNTGWVSNSGIFKTTDGGVSWIIQSRYSTGGIGARCIGFFNAQTGFAGMFSRSTTTSFLHKTTNGGTNWAPVTNLPVSIDSNGACGIYIVNSQVAYVTGRWNNPAMIIKTTNGGESWTNVNINNLATGLVTVKFFSPDTGFAIGHTGTGFYATYRAVVLYTVNGGTNWSVVHNGSYLYQNCWKITFISRQIGFISIQNEGTTIPNIFLKTTNGGLNWQEHNSAVISEEGIGFVNENTGWVGSDHYPHFSVFKTINGGQSWFPDNSMKHINKIVFLNDTLGFCAGATLYRYSKDSISAIQQISTVLPEDPYLSQNYPNPFNPATKIRFYLPTSLDKNVKLSVYDNTGKELNTLINERLLPGGYEVEWNAANYPSGVYYYKLTIENYTETRKMLLVK